jgi:hypothetical protein
MIAARCVSGAAVESIQDIQKVRAPPLQCVYYSLGHPVAQPIPPYKPINQLESIGQKVSLAVQTNGRTTPQLSRKLAIF